MDPMIGGSTGLQCVLVAPYNLTVIGAYVTYGHSTTNRTGEWSIKLQKITGPGGGASFSDVSDAQFPSS